MQPDQIFTDALIQVIAGTISGVLVAVIVAFAPRAFGRNRTRPQPASATPAVPTYESSATTNTGDIGRDAYVNTTNTSIVQNTTTNVTNSANSGSSDSDVWGPIIVIVLGAVLTTLSFVVFFEVLRSVVIGVVVGLLVALVVTIFRTRRSSQPWSGAMSLATINAVFSLIAVPVLWVVAVQTQRGSFSIAMLQESSRQPDVAQDERFWANWFASLWERFETIIALAGKDFFAFVGAVGGVVLVTTLLVRVLVELYDWNATLVYFRSEYPSPRIIRRAKVFGHRSGSALAMTVFVTAIAYLFVSGTVGDWFSAAQEIKPFPDTTTAP